MLQRENIGASKTATEIQEQLNRWLQTLVTKMNNPGPELAAKHPLRDAEVSVEECPENPGYYKLLLYMMPHFQVEGVDVRLSMVGQLPKKIEN